MVFVLLFLFGAVFFSPSALAKQSALEVLPLNPDFVDFMSSRVSGGGTGGGGNPTGLVPDTFVIGSEGHACGLIPDLFTLKFYSETQHALQVGSLPSRYDLRELGYVTTVKDQNPYGTCWAFATYGSLESDILFKNQIYYPSLDEQQRKRFDFSENHLVNNSGFDLGFNDGGNIMMSSAYLARGDGPVLEECDPYPNPGSSNDCERVRYVEHILWIPKRTELASSYLADGVPGYVNVLKSALYKYGAVYTCMYWDSSYYDDSSKTYYYNGDDRVNHGVVIVGWDDNMETGAPSPGAWIVKNSWGEDWGDEGYFYISYYDTKVASCTSAVFDDFPDVNNGNFTVYQYDVLGAETGLQSFTGVIYGASAFVADGNQTIVAVSFFSLTPGDYEVYVFKGCSKPDECGDPSATKGGTINFAGYHTIFLDDPVEVKEGDHFLVEVKLEKELTDTGPALGFERKISDFSSAATCNLGESYVSTNGTDWGDVCGDYYNIYNVTHVCVKALAVPSGVSNSAPEIEAFEVDPKEGCAPLTVTLRCVASDPDGDALSYEWDFDGDGSVDETTANGTVEHTYNETGQFCAKVKVSDGKGGLAESVCVNINVKSCPSGDANGDGEIDVRDVVCIINNILGTDNCGGDSDCNGDGEVDVRDVICVINKILGH